MLSTRRHSPGSVKFFAVSLTELYKLSIFYLLPPHCRPGPGGGWLLPGQHGARDPRGRARRAGHVCPGPRVQRRRHALLQVSRKLTISLSPGRYGSVVSVVRCEGLPTACTIGREFLQFYNLLNMLKKTDQH